MLSVKFVGMDSVKSGLITDLRNEVRLLADSVYTELRKNTPVDTGVARRGWRKKTATKDFEVSNNVPYIGVLDKGRHMTPKGMRGSKQAPRGIVGPSLDNIKRKN